ncbi:GIY-YIG nuclease family protein [Gloeocapsopsis crepidinum LEGE 06123]|uniref:GIY-YIG nuclease family protein n=1 Tax=Gloeocapsopsis crepidinum LEGE 06123 TaxID=588587 RepID=A0ABR9UYG3_9CHRO|nr:competence protein CoiA family protein [Gloeocapsopsis crepidinum]MBE9193353.1 GIY-YIG nuclease family protein [Gloeocapsopsis crepidinum LEGE 06123]
MWLRYGVDANNILVDVEDIASGKTQLICPYCGGKLTAKKGRIKEHHFAHTEESCQFMVVNKHRELPTLPLYDSFNIRLSGEDLEQLKVLWREYGAKGCSILHFAVPKQFVWHGLLHSVESSALEYQFTHLGQIPVAALPLELFNYVQEPLLLEKLYKLKQKAELASNSSLFFLERLVDYKIYCAQYQKILRQTLYYLQIKADGNILHKIGVTQRSIEQRLVEIQRDLKQHFRSVAIEILGTWSHRGNVELCSTKY